jgi:hypothetical protein
MNNKLENIRNKYEKPLILYKTTQTYIKYKHTFGNLLSYNTD